MFAKLYFVVGNLYGKKTIFLVKSLFLNQKSVKVFKAHKIGHFSKPIHF